MVCLFLNYACYHSVQILLSRHLTSRSVKIKMGIAVVCLSFCMGLKFCLSHQGKILPVLENRVVLRRLFGGVGGHNCNSHNLYLQILR
jgi:hypothetical protein